MVIEKDKSYNKRKMHRRERENMNFSFYMPTKILVGQNVVLENYQEFKGMGKKAFIITGKSSKRNGALSDVIEALNKCGIEYVVFDEIEENPSFENIEEATAMGRDNKVDFLIAIGGGSPIDAAKVIGIFLKNPLVDRENIFTLKGLQSLDLIAVPTTSGTGTETTQYAIVTDHKAETKRNFSQSVFAKIAFLDGRYTMNMPMGITISTAVDAFSHLVEGYLNRRANILSDGLAELGIKIWGSCVQELIKGEISLKIREKLMMASTIAGMVIAQTGTSLPHGMGYPLTYYKGIPHGLANGVLYIEYLKVFKERQKVNKLPMLLQLKSYDEMESIIKELTKLNINIDISLKEIEQYAEGMASNKGKLINHPEEIGYNEIFNIYKNSFNI